MSVAEAMLAGDIPVVTRAGALPEVVGDAGRAGRRRRPAATSPTAIAQALAMDEGARAGAAARARALRLEGAAERAAAGRGGGAGRGVSAASRQPLQRHADAAHAGDAPGDGARRGRRRAAPGGPHRERAAGARGGAARPGGGAVPALRHDVQRDRLPAAPAPRRRRGDPGSHLASGVRTRRAAPRRCRAGCCTCSTATAASSRRSRWRAACGRRATATARARGWCRWSRPPTSAAGACGRSTRSARCSTSRRGTTCARTSTARG